MKAALLALSLVASAAAQSINIAYPTSGQTVVAGQNTTVQLELPNQLTPVQQVSVVVSYQDCRGDPTCASVGQTSMGPILYSGNYTPVYHEQNLPPYDNVSILIPSTSSVGTNYINVAHFFLLGAGSQPILEFKNVSINTQNSTTASRRAYIRGRAL